MTVSVIIPCFNRATLVGETIECVLRQTLPPTEIIAVDDGSTDSTVAVLESFGSRVKVIRQKNTGPAAARNVGLAAATGDFVWFMDSDDLASLNKLEVQVRVLEETGGNVAMAPWIRCRLHDGQAHAETHVLQQKGLPDNLPLALVSRWTILLQTALFRRSLFEKAGGFDPSYVIAEDQLLFLKCLLAGANVVHTPECLIVYRTEGANKLTTAGFAAERRFVDWARFLLEGRRLCLQTGVDPMRWFSFRMRLWCAWCDLDQCKTPAAKETAESVNKALNAKLERSSYPILRRSFQLMGGLRQRTSGDRSPLALRAGPLREEQTALISELGYTVVE